MSSPQFRPCAGAIVFNSEGLVLLGNRIDTQNNAWQFPQGGIEKDEKPLQAALRELKEETSIVSVEVIDIDSSPYRYEFDSKAKQNLRKRNISNDGQDIYFGLFYFKGKESEININTSTPEFKDYRWDTFDFAFDNVIDFKKEAYKHALLKFKPLIEQYLNKIS